eukprot:15176608-Alexandrium_andersonii.AAC.1
MREGRKRRVADIKLHFDRDTHTTAISTGPGGGTGLGCRPGLAKVAGVGRGWPRLQAWPNHGWMARVARGGTPRM